VDGRGGVRTSGLSGVKDGKQVDKPGKKPGKKEDLSDGG
jgi:hypothetical protein